MRTIFFLFIFSIGLPYSTYAQVGIEQRANNYFERAFYSDAIPLYEQLILDNKSKRVLKNLAESYYNTFNMQSAARWYKTLTTKYGPNVEEVDYFNLTQSLKALGKYNEAKETLKDYYSRLGDTLAFQKLMQDTKYLENVGAIGNRFIIKNLPLNSSASEFGAIQIDSNLIYTSANKKNSSIKKIYRWNNQSYLDIYSHPMNKIDQRDYPSKGLQGQINTKMHEGTFAITKDRKTIYFTRNNFIRGKKKTDAKKIVNLKIYKAEWTGTEWGNILELAFNSDKFSTEHPTINKDETKLYFSSDRPGGYGSFDLYSVNILPNGLYGNPTNLGATINTSKKEQFPFLDLEDNLYFASNGHPGFGLLDIFVSINESGSFKKPDNLGLPINSGYDDFSISFSSEKKGYFSSNRPNGKGSDDIYSFVETKPLIIEDCHQFVSGTLTDQITKQPIPNGIVHLINSKGQILKEVFTDNNATFNFNINCNSAFTIVGNHKGYKENSKTLMTTKERKKTFDGSLTLLSLLEIKKQLEEKEQKEREIQLAKEKQVKEETKKARKAKINDIIQQENALVKEKNRTLIKTQEIHFDYSLWYLRRESRERLKVVIQIMKQNPGITIEIGTHTDIRGDKNYNKRLSQKRADVVKDYLIKNGISKKRIIANGYGESRPLVECKTENDCAEEDHEWNRRCEFVIVKWD
ncbi:OmpA family protein [Flagellimonas pacifica]|uniref:WD40-like Beta Propeller Repeat n=1 Tax=Flagellimonas pacifica TaxID=1247520 RepID=A0A285MWI3_9FLAO|nr:OmpA family protein [Allomuricauda parva]SNZ01560.1 WD40-like Beta Propeller Repeat [Allomuricauda parva]